METEIQRCTTRSQIRELALKEPSIKCESDIAQRLELKGRKFSVGTTATEAKINDLWSQLKEIDPVDLNPTKFHVKSLKTFKHSKNTVAESVIIYLISKGVEILPVPSVSHLDLDYLQTFSPS